MRVLLLGAGGMLGRAVRAAVPDDVNLRAFTRSELDVCHEPQLRAALGVRPDWVINCAAWTKVDAAEDHEAEATRINGDAVGALGRLASDAGARVLHFSTDYVFDGTLERPYREDDAPNPQSAYGRSKLAGERTLTASGARWAVVRTQWLYGGGPSFVRTMWGRARDGAGARVVDDQWGAPTHVIDVAAIVWKLVREGAEGTWHAAAGGEATWYDVARAVYVAAGADPGLVVGCSTKEFGARAPRPLNGRLDTGKLGGLRHWEGVLAEMLRLGRFSVSGP